MHFTLSSQLSLYQTPICAHPITLWNIFLQIAKPLSEPVIIGMLLLRQNASTHNRFCFVFFPSFFLSNMRLRWVVMEQVGQYAADKIHHLRTSRRWKEVPAANEGFPKKKVLLRGTHISQHVSQYEIHDAVASSETSFLGFKACVKHHEGLECLHSPPL